MMRTALSLRAYWPSVAGEELTSCHVGEVSLHCDWPRAWPGAAAPECVASELLEVSLASEQTPAALSVWRSRARRAGAGTRPPGPGSLL